MNDDDDLNDDQKFHHKRGVFLVLSVMMRDHRWPKRNITGSGPVRNMRVCMGEIEFET